MLGDVTVFSKSKNSSPEYDISQHIGAVCEVLTEDNQVLFVGAVKSYLPSMRELRVGLQFGTCTHGSVIYGSLIKLRILPKNTSDPITFLYGTIEKFKDDEWVISFDHAVSHQDRRENFRLRIAADGKIRYTDPELHQEETCSCQIIDISVTGVLLQCKIKFEVGQTLELSLPPLVPDSSSYLLDCVVRRILDHTEYAYGCEFHRLTAKQDQQLYQDLFALQSKNLKIMTRRDQ